MEEKNRLDEKDVADLKQEKVRTEIEISSLKQELETVKKAHEELCMQSDLRAEEHKSEYEKRIQELECGLVDARNQAEKLEAFIESKSVKWKNREDTYQSFISNQFGAFQVWYFVHHPCDFIFLKTVQLYTVPLIFTTVQELRAVMESLKDDVLKTKRSYSEEFKYLGRKDCLKLSIVYNLFIFNWIYIHKMWLFRDEAQKSS